MINVENSSKSLEAKAVIKYVKSSPFKLRRVANLIRGKQVSYALQILKNLPHKGAGLLYKALYSAQHNAINNHNLDGELYVSEIMINQGPQSKRFQPKARGRIYQIIKKTSHIQVTVKQR